MTMQQLLFEGTNWITTGQKNTSVDNCTFEAASLCWKATCQGPVPSQISLVNTMKKQYELTMQQA